MKLSSLHIIILTSTIFLAQAEAGTLSASTRQSQNFKSSDPDDDGATVASPVHSASNIKIASIAEPAPPPPAPVQPVQPAQPAPPPQPPVVITPPVPAAAPVDPNKMPACNPKDPNAFTTDTKSISNALSSVLGYNHAFNPHYNLTQEATLSSVFSGKCHAAISSVNVQDKTIPLIVVGGCIAPTASPAKACQAKGVIRFVVDTSKQSGELGGQKSIELNFTRADADRWRVTSPQKKDLDLTLYESETGK